MLYKSIQTGKTEYRLFQAGKKIHWRKAFIQLRFQSSYFTGEEKSDK